MGIDLHQLKQFIVVPTLQTLGAGFSSPAAVNLVTGVANAESRAAFLRQTTNSGYGPARGLWQTEPASHDDLWRNFLRYRPDVAKGVYQILNGAPPSADLLVSRLDYACAVCRLILYRAPAPLPAADDAAGMNAYWKNYYNTAIGAGSVDTAHTQLFQEAIDA